MNPIRSLHVRIVKVAGVIQGNLTRFGAILILASLIKFFMTIIMGLRFNPDLVFMHLIVIAVGLAMILYDAYQQYLSKGR